MKLNQIAEEILVFLKRFEADPNINAPKKVGGTHPYYSVNVCVAGSFVRIEYVSYQGDGSCLKKADAMLYLEWLKAGNVGKHWKAIGRI